MKKYFLLLFLLSGSLIFAQNVKFAVLKNYFDASQKGVINPDSLFNAITRHGNTDFLFSIGNLTKNGMLQNLEQAKFFLDSTRTNFQILPGKNEFKQKISTLFNITRVLGDGSFITDLGSLAVVGIQVIDPLDYDKSYISAETIAWLKNNLSTITGRNVILLFSSAVKDIANFSILVPLLRSNPVIKIITPEIKTVKKVVSTRNRRKRPDNSKESTPYLFIYELNENIINTYSLNSGNSFKLDESEKLGSVDLAKLIPAVKGKGSIKPLFKMKSSTYSKIIPYKNQFITAALDGRIICLSSDFKEQWNVKVNGNIAGTPVITDGKAVFASTQGDIYILDLDERRIVQSMGTDCEIVSPISIIEYKGNKELFIPKTTSSKKAIIFSGSNGTIYCYDLETLQELWINRDSTAPLAGNFIEAGNLLVFKNCDNKVICMDGRNGLLIWRWGYRDSEADTRTPLQFNGKQVITLTTTGSIATIDLLLGVSEWETEKTVFRDLTIEEKNLISLLALNGGKITNFNSKTGKKNKETKVTVKTITSFLRPDTPLANLYFYDDINNIYKSEDLKSFKKAGYAGDARPVSVFSSGNNIYILNSDGDIFKAAQGK